MLYVQSKGAWHIVGYTYATGEHKTEFKISYFYNVRHMKPYQVPVSTAMYDLKWFHNNQGNGHVFIDKEESHG